MRKLGGNAGFSDLKSSRAPECAGGPVLVFVSLGHLLCCVLNEERCLACKVLCSWPVFQLLVSSDFLLFLVCLRFLLVVEQLVFPVEEWLSCRGLGATGQSVARVPSLSSHLFILERLAFSTFLLMDT